MKGERGDVKSVSQESEDMSKRLQGIEEEKKEKKEKKKARGKSKGGSH